MKITFPDGSVKDFDNGTTPLQIAESISPRLAQDVLAASVNGQEWDLSRPINEDAELSLYKWEDAEGKHAFWHSSAHLLAEALQELYPGVKFLKCFGEQVGGAVPESMFALGIFPLVQAELCVFVDGAAQIPFLTVDRSGEHVLCQSRTYAFCNLQRSRAVVKVFDTSVRKSDFHLLYRVTL